MSIKLFYKSANLYCKEFCCMEFTFNHYTPNLVSGKERKGALLGWSGKVATAREDESCANYGSIFYSKILIQ